MQPTFLKFTEDSKAAFEARFPDAYVAELVEKARKAPSEDTGTFDVIISTEGVDRGGDIVVQAGLNQVNYKRNPIVLWGHDYYGVPIGFCTELYATTYNGLPATGARGMFFPAEVNPLAQQVRKMYDFAMAHKTGAGTTTSIGFIPEKYDAENPHKILEWQILEFSFVPVPMNAETGPAAGVQFSMEDARALGLDITALQIKGMEFLTKKKKEIGDSCQQDDGTPGILATDPNDPDGPLICVPEDEDKGQEPVEAKAPETMDKEKMEKAIAEEHKRHAGEVTKAIDAFAEAFEGAEDKKAFDVQKSLDIFKESLTAEHDMHRDNNIKCFKSFDIEKAKAPDPAKEAVKALSAEHDRHDAAKTIAVDTFQKKLFQGIESGDNDAIDWVYGKMQREGDTHTKAVGKCVNSYAESFEPAADEEKSMSLAELLIELGIDEKVGAKLSAASKKALAEAHDHLKKATAVIEALHPDLANGGAGEEPADAGNGEGSGKGSKPSDTSAGAEVGNFLMRREILRSINAVSNRELARMNEEQRAAKV